MAKLPGYIVIESADEKTRTVQVRLRYWHPTFLGELAATALERAEDYGISKYNPLLWINILRVWIVAIFSRAPLRSYTL